MGLGHEKIFAWFHAWVYLSKHVQGLSTNRVTFVGCGCNEFSQICNMFFIQWAVNLASKGVNEAGGPVKYMEVRQVLLELFHVSHARWPRRGGLMQYVGTNTHCYKGMMLKLCNKILVCVCVCVCLAQRLECSPMARETWVQSQVESYQRL